MQRLGIWMTKSGWATRRASSARPRPTYGRLWLSVAHHPGDTVSCTQAEALVLAAEARLGLRPRRRTELLRQRIQACEQQVAQTGERLERQQQAVKQAKDRLAEAEQQVQEQQKHVDALEQDYQSRKLQERPTSRLAQARKRLQAVVKRATSRTSVWKQAQHRVDKTMAQWSHQQAELAHLYQRLISFEQDNAANSEPIEAEFRLDAGFGTYENVALLIEMGYDLYTKPHSHKIVTYLKGQVDDTTAWTRVGANAELVAWPNLQLKHCPYPLDVAAFALLHRQNPQAERLVSLRCSAGYGAFARVVQAVQRQADDSCRD